MPVFPVIFAWNTDSCASATAGLVLFMLVAALTPSAKAHHHGKPDPGRVADREPDQRYNEQEEAFMHTPAGFNKAGKPATAKGSDAGVLNVTVANAATGEPAFCRVCVVGPNGDFYEPLKNSLSRWSRQRTGLEETHGPSRYYGWYFYTGGQFTVTVPAGKTRIEAWKGYEFRPQSQLVDVAAGATKAVRLELTRTAAMSELGYYSGDTHIHLNRQSKSDDERAIDLMAAEDIEYGFLLCMNDPRHYRGAMDEQEWPQDRGLGANSVLRRGRYGIASGQEYRANTYGHICLLMHDRLVLEGASVNPNEWPVFGQIGRRTRELGGYAFHAHGGYSQEIFADYVQQATDGVELLQMAHYRGIGLKGWYRILNIGFRFPALAGSDFPYGRALGDCRNYVHAERRPSFGDWVRRAAEGRSFFTTGPLLLLEVNGRRPGDTISLTGSGNHRLNVTARVRSEVTPVDRLDLVVNGQAVARQTLPADGQIGAWHELTRSLTVEKPSWIAARAHSLSATGRPDAECHTNPVYVYVDGRKPFQATDLDWLVEQLDARLAALRERSFPGQQQALEFFEKSRAALLQLRRRQQEP